MNDTVFSKDGEEHKFVSKSNFNLYAFIFGFIYFAYKKDFKFSLISLVYALVASFALNEVGILLSCAINAYLANHRLHKFYIDDDYYVVDIHDQQWINENIKGFFGRG